MKRFSIKFLGLFLMIGAGVFFFKFQGMEQLGQIYENLAQSNPVRSFLAQGRILFGDADCLGIETVAYDEDDNAYTVAQILVKPQPSASNPCGYYALNNLLIASTFLSGNNEWLGDDPEIAFLTGDISEQLFGKNQATNWRGSVLQRRLQAAACESDPEGGENLYPEEIVQVWDEIRSTGFFEAFDLPKLTVVGSAHELDDVEAGARYFDLQSCKDILELRDQLRKNKFLSDVRFGEFGNIKEIDIEVDPYAEPNKPIMHAFVLGTGHQANAHWFSVLFYQKTGREFYFYVFDSQDNELRMKGDRYVDNLVRAIFQQDLNFTIASAKLKNLEQMLQQAITRGDMDAFVLNTMYHQLGGQQEFADQLNTLF